MSVRLLEVAQQELDEAIAYYNGQAPGLGDAFLLETVAAIDRIRRFPRAMAGAALGNIMAAIIAVHMAKSIIGRTRRAGAPRRDRAHARRGPSARGRARGSRR